MPKQSPFKKINNYYIETGAYLGDSINLALQNNFNKIYSIELAEYYANYCKKRFKNNQEVEIILGDSFFELEKLLHQHPTISFTYWLDGHYSGSNTAFGVQEFPILKELEVILKRNVTNEIIYIDDMRLLKNLNADINQTKINEVIQNYKPQAAIEFEPSIYDSQDILIIQY